MDTTASTLARPTAGDSDDSTTVVYLDLDSVLIQTRRGERGPEVYVRPGIEDGLDRLREVTDHVVVLAGPFSAAGGSARHPDERLAVLEQALGPRFAELSLVACEHDGSADGCAKPGTDLIDRAVQELSLPARHGWLIVGDQEGVQQGRAAGLRTIRIGPAGEDHLSTVHRPDHEARDVLDAANWMLLESLSGS